MGEERREVGDGQVLLGHEGDHRGRGQDLSRNKADIGRGQHDPGPGAGRGQRRGYREPVQSGKVDVQQYPVRASADRGGQRLLPVRGRLEQVEAAFGQQRSRRGAEARAVVDN